MKPDAQLDCYGLLCPMPVIQAAKKIKELRVGEVLEILATDEGITADLPAWCRMSGQEYLGQEKDGDTYRAFIRKVKD